MENYEKNGLPEYIGAVVALTALLMGYCTFSPKRQHSLRLRRRSRQQKQLRLQALRLAR